MAHSFIYTSNSEAINKANSLISHPLDLITVTNESFDPKKKDNKALTVDSTRAMIKSAYISPLGDNKVFVIPNAENITLNSQNALLKLIEEPPPHVFFFFITPTPKSLLPTILSRSEIVYSTPEIEINSEIYNQLLPLCKAFVDHRHCEPNFCEAWQSKRAVATPIACGAPENTSASSRYALEFALTNLKDEKEPAIRCLENIFSFTNSQIGDNIIKSIMQKRIFRARQQIKSNCNWQSICYQLTKTAD